MDQEKLIKQEPAEERTEKLTTELSAEEFAMIVQELLEKFEVTDKGPNNAGRLSVQNNIKEEETDE